METPRDLELHVPTVEEQEENRPSYEPVEGLDYIVDLYAISDVERDASPEEIYKKINERLLEYHPDRLQGMAKEFQTAGDETTKILLRAKKILLDETNRREYDEILNNWKGPISDSWIPAISLDRYRLTERLMMTPDELEADIQSSVHRHTALLGGDPKQVEALEAILPSLTGEARQTILGQIDEALANQDTVLAFEEGFRVDALGLETKNRDFFNLSLGYSDKVVGELEAANTELEEVARARAESDVAEQLALMAGEPTSETGQLVAATTNFDRQALALFDSQTEKIRTTTQAREELLKKRLTLAEPVFPLAELQAEAQPLFILGMDFDGTIHWMGFNYTYEKENKKVNAASFDLDDEVSDHLKAKNFEPVINAGFNVLIIKNLASVDPKVAVEEGINKYLKHFGITTED